MYAFWNPSAIFLFWFGLYAVFAAYLAFSTSYCFSLFHFERTRAYACMWNQEDSYGTSVLNWISKQNKKVIPIGLAWSVLVL